MNKKLSRTTTQSAILVLGVIIVALNVAILVTLIVTSSTHASKSAIADTHWIKPPVEYYEESSSEEQEDGDAKAKTEVIMYGGN